jgi:glucosylceramidase
VVTALLSGCVNAAAPLGGSDSVTVTYSSSDGSQQLQAGADLSVSAETTDTAATTISVAPGETGQTLDGFGGSLESSSVWNIAQLSTEKRAKLMNALFDREHGNGYNLMRLSFGCPDFCAEDFYTYDDMPDGQTDVLLKNFSIQKDIDTQIISVAKQALTINPDVEFFASAWSPPAWMKDNHQLNLGGVVLPEFYPVLATYYRLAIEAYAQHGIPIKALTVNNEPQVVPDYPSATWSWEQERDFIPYLRAELDAGSLDTEIWIQDDNWGTTPQFANILADPTVGPMVDGVAVHDYDGGDVTQAAALVRQYPDITVRLTERSYYDVKGMDRIIQLLRNDISSWTYWLTFLDEDGMPNRGPLDGNSFPQQIGASASDLNGWYLNRDYFLYGQFTRFLQRGAVRVDSDYGSTNTVTTVVFRNPDGQNIAVVVNQTGQDQPFRLVSIDGEMSDTLPPETVGTYRWTPSRGVIDRSGWHATSSENGVDASLMVDGDAATGWRNFGPQTPGESFTLDLGSTQTIDGITLDAGTLDGGASAGDWPVGYAVFTSVDGVNWNDAATGAGTARLTSAIFPEADARYLKVELTDSEPDRYWTVAEAYATRQQGR